MTIEKILYTNKRTSAMFIRRNCWTNTLCIKLYLSNETNSLLKARYCVYGKEKRNSIQNAVVLQYDDFIICNKYGEEIKQSRQIKENKMKNKNYIGGDYEVVECVYGEESTSDGTKYVFKIDKDLVSAISIDDIVVVDSQNGFAICKIVKIVDNNIHNANIIKKATAWVVDKIDQTMHNKRIQATERREYIVQQLEEKKQQIEAIAVYEMLAKSDPATAKLVEELKSIGLK